MGLARKHNSDASDAPVEAATIKQRPSPLSPSQTSANNPVYLISTAIDWMACYSTMIPIALVVFLQGWAIIGSAIHPITTDESGLNSLTVYELAKQASSLDVTGVWPYPSQIHPIVDVFAGNSMITQNLLYTNPNNSTRSADFQNELCPPYTEDYPSSCKVTLATLDLRQPLDYYTQMGLKCFALCGLKSCGHGGHRTQQDGFVALIFLKCFKFARIVDTAKLKN